MPPLARASVDMSDSLYRVIIPNSIFSLPYDFTLNKYILDETNFAKFVGDTISCVSYSVLSEYKRRPEDVLSPLLNKQRKGIIKFSCSTITRDIGRIKFLENRLPQPSNGSSNNEIFKYAHCEIFNPDCRKFHPDNIAERMVIINAINESGWEWIYPFPDDSVR